MKGKWDDFIDDMVKDNTPPSKADPKEVNMNELGKMMEEQVKKAFEKASKEEPVKVPKKDISPELEEEPEDIDTDEDDNKEDL